MTTKVPFSMIDPQRVIIVPSGGDDRANIHAAVARLTAMGGGTLLFSPGNYQIIGTDATIQVPEIQPDLSVATSPSDAQLYFQNLADITFAFDGATLTSSKTDGGTLLVLDGCNNVRLENPRLRGATTMVGETVTVTGTGGIQILSLSAPSSSITIVNPDLENLYSGIDCAGDPVNVARVVGVSILGCSRFKSGYYAFAFRNNGDNVVIENAHVDYSNRPYFVYGIQNHKANITADNMNGGFQSLIKAYSRPTGNIDLRLLVKNRANVTSRLGIQSQHNPVAQPIPAWVDNVIVDYVEDASVAGASIDFSYYQNSVLTATCANTLFNRITLRGRAEGSVESSVSLTNAAALCLTDMDGMVCSNGTGLLSLKGFVASMMQSYTPSLTFDNAAVGMTYASRAGEYYVKGGICQVVGRIALSAKGTSTGNALISLPIPVRPGTSRNSLALVQAVAGFSALAGAPGAFLLAGGNQISLFTHGAAATVGITHTNLTDTSVINFQVSYPV